LKIFLKPVTNYINPLLSKTSKQQITTKETQKSLNNPFLHLLLVHCKIPCLLPLLPFKPKPTKEYTAETKIMDCEPSCKDTQAKPRKKTPLLNLQPKPVPLQRTIDFSLIRSLLSSPPTPKDSNFQSTTSCYNLQQLHLNISASLHRSLPPQLESRLIPLPN
jgi:hypothetical protein